MNLCTKAHCIADYNYLDRMYIIIRCFLCKYTKCSKQLLSATLFLFQSPRGSSKSITSSSGNRLPTVEQRNRLQRLAKPRPLSKTMLTASK